jgi:hypothetical protein
MSRKSRTVSVQKHFWPDLSRFIEGWDGSDREARSGNVGKPQRDPWEIADREVSLSGSLGYSVAGEGACRMIDRYRNVLGPPVAQRGLKVDKPADTHVPRRLDGVDRTRDVGRHIFSPIVRILVRGSAVYHVRWREPAKGGIDQLPVGNRPVENFEPGQRRQRLATAGGEIVNDEYLVALRKIFVDKIDAEAAGPPVIRSLTVSARLADGCIRLGRRAAGNKRRSRQRSRRVV